MPATNPYSQYNFELEVDGTPVAGFSEVSGLTMELDTVAYRRAGSTTTSTSCPASSPMRIWSCSAG